MESNTFAGWMGAVLTGFFTMILGAFATGAAANYWVRWYHVSSREGLAGYSVLLWGLMGGVAGLVVGVVSARWMATATETRPLLGFAMGTGATLVLVAAAHGVSWLAADFPPRLEGRRLELELEVRCPAGMEWPRPKDDFHPYLSLPRGSADVDVDRAQRQADGSSVLRRVVRLASSRSGRELMAWLSHDADYRFQLPLAGHPRRSDLEWSPWLRPYTALLKGQWQRPVADPTLTLRYRVRFVDEAPSEPLE